MAPGSVSTVLYVYYEFVIYNNFGWIEHRVWAQTLGTGQETFTTKLIWILHVAMCCRYKEEMNTDHIQHYYNQSLP